MAGLAETLRKEIDELIKEVKADDGIKDMSRIDGLVIRVQSATDALIEERVGLISEKEELMKKLSDLTAELKALKQQHSDTKDDVDITGDGLVKDDEEVKKDEAMIVDDTKPDEMAGPMGDDITQQNSEVKPAEIGAKKMKKQGGILDWSSTKMNVVKQRYTIKSDTPPKWKKALAGGPEFTYIDRLPINDREKWSLKVKLVIRFTFRGYFGLGYYNRCGYFIDEHMCKQIIDYSYYFAYSKGDHILKGDLPFIHAAVVSSDNHFLFACTQRKSIVKYDMTDYSMVYQWIAHDSYVTALAYHTSGILVSGAGDKKIKVWNALKQGELIHTLNMYSGAVRNLDINDAGTRIISASEDKLFRLWSVQSGHRIAIFRGHTDWVTSVHFIDQAIISGSNDKSMMIWDPSSVKSTQKITDGVSGMVYDMSINSDESMIACFYGGLTIYSWPEMKVVNTVDTMESSHGKFHPTNPEILAVANDKDHSIHIYNTTKNEFIHTLKGHTKSINYMCFSPDGCRLISVANDRSTRIWDTSDI